MRIACFLLLLFGCFSAFAQPMIQGTVVDAEKGSPLSDVQVTVKQGGLVVQYTSSDKNGEFAMEAPSAEGVLSFALMGYKTAEVSISGISGRLRIRLQPRLFALKEVTIKAPKIRGQGDTIMYHVSQFSSERDKTIGDVLKKMPGIDIDTQGKITYNGKSINKFYIEGQDLLGGRYGIAVNGIPQQEVGQIEVYEDHQPIRALEGLSFSDRAAINVKLKENAKAHWIATLEIGSGVPTPLWEAKLFAMRIKEKSQNITTLKSNNNGHDLSRECKTIIADAMMEEENFYDRGNYIEVSLPATPFLASERTLDNRSHLFSTNQLWGLKNDYQLRGQINYLNDETRSEATSETIYYLPGEENYALTESEQGKKHEHTLATNLTIIGNKKNFYLHNALNTEWKWSNTDLATRSGEENIGERADLPSYKISNNFSLVKRMGKRSLSLYSYTLLQSDPHELDIRRGEEGQMHQSVTSDFLFNNTSASYSLAVKKLILSMTGGAGAFLHRMESSTSNGYLPSGDHTPHRAEANYVRAYLTPKLELNRKVLIVTLQCPIDYYHYFYKTGTTNQNKDHCFYAPSLRIQYNIMPDLKWSTSGGISQKKPDVFAWYDGVIMQDYRNARQGYIADRKNTSKTVSTNLSYKNLAWLLFANIHAMAQWDNQKYIDNRDFRDDGLIVHSLMPQAYQSNSQVVSARISKGIDWINGAASVQGTYYVLHSQMSQNRVLMPYSMSMAECSGDLNGEVGDVLDWNYRIGFSRQGLSTDAGRLFSSKKLSNKVSTDWHFWKKVTFRVDAEHYSNEVSEDNFKHVFFLDASIVYKISKKYEVSLDASNLLDKNLYDYTLNNTLSTYISKQRIRGRNVFVRFFCLL